MDPESVLEKSRKEIVGHWFDAVMAAYPPDGARFFKKTSDPFANPVGSTIHRCLNELFDQVRHAEMDGDAVQSALDGIVRIQSLQECKPSAAISFIFTIKPTISAKLERYSDDPEVRKYLGALDANIEELLKSAFDLYLQCRQKVFQLRANQARDRVSKLLIKKGYIEELPKKGDNLEDITA
jgi:hypothetical protein